LRGFCALLTKTGPKRTYLRLWGTILLPNRHGEAISNQKVGVFVELENKEGHDLGIPLPTDTIRVYKHEKEGSPRFLGEDAIDHTPKDEESG
jgi:hypothetical protein